MSPISRLIAVNPYNGASLSSEALATLDWPWLVTSGFLQWLQTELVALPHALCWLELRGEQLALAPLALAHGFRCHHCHDSQLMLVKRLQPEAYLPLAATHSIGVGGAVFRANGDILLVREQPLAQQAPGYWKLPGGMVEPKEHLADAVVREVQEETGVRARFERLISIRHHHQGQFGASNFYMVALLTALSEQLVADPKEIAELAWVAPRDFLTDPQASPYNQCLVRAALAARQTLGTGLDESGWHSFKVDGYRQAPASYEMFAAPIDPFVGD